jgi:hypothetical protein
MSDNDDETGFETSAELRRSNQMDDYTYPPTEPELPMESVRRGFGRGRTMVLVAAATLLILAVLVIYFLVR